MNWKQLYSNVRDHITNMDWKFLYFSFHGRISRKQFIISMVIFFVVCMLISIALSLLSLTFWYFSFGNPTMSFLDLFSKETQKYIYHTFKYTDHIINILWYLVLITWVNLALVIKRFHDFNKPIWPLILAWISLIVFLALLGILAKQHIRFRDLEDIYDIFDTILLLIALILAVFLKGTHGPNKYGPDPLANKNESPLKSNQPKLF